MSVFFLSYIQSDLFGKLILFSLVGLSVICWIVLLHKVALLRKIQRESKWFHSKVQQHRGSVLELDLPEVGGALFSLSPYSSIYGDLRQKAVEMLEKNRFFLLQKGGGDLSTYLTSADLSLLENHVSAMISFHRKRLEKNLFILSTIVSLAPFIGLLGTVWGILTTFSGLQGGSHLNTVVLSGISTALTTTVMGLVIAIPALVAYNYLRNGIRAYVSDMDDFLVELLSHVELRYRKIE